MILNRDRKANSEDYASYGSADDYYYEPALKQSRKMSRKSDTRYKYQSERSDILIPNRPRLDGYSESRPRRPGRVSRLNCGDKDVVDRKEHTRYNGHNVSSRVLADGSESRSNFPVHQNGASFHSSTQENPSSTKPTMISFSAKERMKLPQLRGADLYVARLGRMEACGKNARGHLKHASRQITASSPNSNHPKSEATMVQDTASGSLHDELINPYPRTRESKTTKSKVPHIVPPHAVDSRPCYRCVEYMHSCGIARVFWTDQNGQWKRAKVQDMVMALRQADGQCGSDPSIFITKHEVLLLRRLMDNCGGRNG